MVVYFVISFWLLVLCHHVVVIFLFSFMFFFFLCKRPVELFDACRNRMSVRLMNNTVPNTSLYTPHTYAHTPCRTQGKHTYKT